jgi:hypothetical protein
VLFENCSLLAEKGMALLEIWLDFLCVDLVVRCLLEEEERPGGWWVSREPVLTF